MASRNFSDLWGSRGVFATNPFTEMHRDLNRLFGDPFRRTAPRLDVRENDDEVCVVADVPGVAPADLDLRIDGATLTLTAERLTEAERADQSYHLMERTRGVMRRSVQLPFAPDPDHVHAGYENGVLTVRMPKAGQKERGRRIDVHGGGETKPSAGGNVGVNAGGRGTGTSTSATGAAGSQSSSFDGSSTAPAGRAPDAASQRGPGGEPPRGPTAGST